MSNLLSVFIIDCCVVTGIYFNPGELLEIPIHRLDQKTK